MGQLLRDRLGKTPAETKANAVLARIMQNEEVPNEEVFDALKEQNSLIVGSPETCRQKIDLYQDLGIDRLLSFQQVGRLLARAGREQHSPDRRAHPRVRQALVQ